MLDLLYALHCWSVFLITRYIRLNYQSSVQELRYMVMMGMCIRL